MIDITHKASTLRTATAQAVVTCSRATYDRVRAGDLPKGNLFDIARAAGMLAAKKTPDLIPHCHPLPLEKLAVSCETVEVPSFGVRVFVEGRTTGRTGLEMEVLTAASVAALTVYDLLKPIDKELEITAVRLLSKEGGKSDRRFRVSPGSKAAVLVISDAIAGGKREDKAGPIVRETMDKFGVEVAGYKTCPADEAVIAQTLGEWAESGIHFIFTVGATGLGPGDIAADVVTPLLDQQVPGIGEAMRSFGQDRTPLAMFSKTVAGTIGGSLVVTLPGSSGGVSESLQAIIPGIFHGPRMLGHDLD